MKPLKKTRDGDVATLVESWRRAHEALETRRLRELRSLNEQDSAQRFALLLRLDGPYPLRLTSGLVEQQSILARLRERS